MDFWTFLSPLDYAREARFSLIGIFSKSLFSPAETPRNFPDELRQRTQKKHILYGFALLFLTIFACRSFFDAFFLPNQKNTAKWSVAVSVPLPLPVQL